MYFRDTRSSPDNIFHENGCKNPCKIYICILHQGYGMFQYCINLCGWSQIVHSIVFFCKFCWLVTCHTIIYFLHTTMQICTAPMFQKNSTAAICKVQKQHWVKLTQFTPQNLEFNVTNKILKGRFIANTNCLIIFV